MSIEAEVRILGRKNAIFLTGEEFTVQITFRNAHPVEAKSLAWCCVQLHCEEQQNVAAKGARKGAGADRTQRQLSTAVAKEKNAIYSSEPAILFCDLCIGPRQTQTFESVKRIPLDLPPSFKGYFVKYTWHLSVAAQHVDAPIRMVQLPIRMFNVGVDIGEERRPIENPFLWKELKGPPFVEIVVNKIEEICYTQRKRTFEIKNSGRHLATVTLGKTMYKLGDDVTGKLEFPQGEVSCLQTLIRVETVETNLLDEKQPESVSAHNTEHMVTAFMRETCFKIGLPVTGVPSFTTEMVKLRWRIHFEFVTTTQELMLQNGSGSMKLADDLHIETMKWHLPISVFSCNPFNISLICPLPSNTSFRI